ncbi:hypothetical protein [Capsulimonas corticalis]|nr:hypothetical protein [Capsulimonas corticalis]
MDLHWVSDTLTDAMLSAREMRGGQYGSRIEVAPNHIAEGLDRCF